MYESMGKNLQQVFYFAFAAVSSPISTVAKYLYKFCPHALDGPLGSRDSYAETTMLKLDISIVRKYEMCEQEREEPWWKDKVLLVYWYSCLA